MALPSSAIVSPMMPGLPPKPAPESCSEHDHFVTPRFSVVGTEYPTESGSYAQEAEQIRRDRGAKQSLSFAHSGHCGASSADGGQTVAGPLTVVLPGKNGAGVDGRGGNFGYLGDRHLDDEPFAMSRALRRHVITD